MKGEFTINFQYRCVPARTSIDIVETVNVNDVGRRAVQVEVNVIQPISRAALVDVGAHAPYQIYVFAIR